MPDDPEPARGADQPAETALTRRDGLPDALRVLLEAFPREDWATHPDFAGLVQFWLERHIMFRRLTEHLREDGQAVLDSRMEMRDYAGRLSRFGGMLVSQLHEHHQIEDHHYFPVLVRLEPRLQRGFAILDRDHQDLDGVLARFTDSANAVLQGVQAREELRDRAAGLAREVEGLERLLDRHLNDEEELVVPVILSHGEGALH